MAKKGRPTLYKPEYCEGIIAFCENHNEVPFLQDYAHLIGVCKDTLQEWASVHPEFSLAYKKAKDIQEKKLVTGGLTGKFNPAVTIFVLKNVSGWRDKQEINQTGTIVIQAEDIKKSKADG